MDAASLHAELQAAAAQYQQQLLELQALLEADPGNAEAAQLRQELRDALEAAQGALRDLQQPAADADAHAAAAAAPAHPHLRQRAAASGMHPDNLYCLHEPDFAALADAHPPLRPYVTQLPGGRPCIDFTSWEATRALTAALLQVDHGVAWDLPPGHLIPPVPNRLNYLHWISSLLALSRPKGPGVVRGLDVGCGASAIYCLLGAAVFGWHMVGLDVCQDSLAAARQLAAANPHLQHLLELRAARPTAPPQPGGSSGALVASAHGSVLLPGMKDAGETFAFCMCNPPFFNSMQEANQNQATACGGTAQEMVCPGGELAFVRRMVADSVAMRGRVHWYSTMCGKKSTLKALRQELHALGVTALRTTELAQGKTSRWAIAWSYSVDPGCANLPLPLGGAASGTAVAGAAAAATGEEGAAAAAAAGAGGAAAAAAAGAAAAAAAGAAAAGAAAGAGWPGARVRLVRQLVWTLATPSSQGGKLLLAIAALLGAKGGRISVNQAAWSVEASLPLRSPPPPPASEQAQRAVKQQQQQQQQEQQEPEDAGAERGEPPSKKHRASPPRQGPGAATAACVGVRLRLQQERRNRFTVVATIANSCGELEARAFMAAMASLKQDLALMWEEVGQ